MVLSKQKNIITSIRTLTVAIFIIIQPLLDFNGFFVGDYITVMGVTIPTLVRYSVLLLIVALLLMEYKVTKHRISNLEKNVFLIYFSLFIIYLSAHFYLGLTYKASIAKDYPFSIFGEINYFIRMVYPLVFLYIVYNTDLAKYKKTIYISLFILVPLSIVLFNLLGLSLSSYSNQVISGNILTWFKADTYLKYSYLSLSSKAFFRYANQISMILALFTSIASYIHFKKPSYCKFASVFILLLAMSMIGTKVALYSFPLMYSSIFVLFLIFERKKLNTKNVKISILSTIVLFVTFAAIYPYTPSVNRSTMTETIISEEMIDENDNEVDEELEVDSTPSSELVIAVEKIYPLKRINSRFLTDVYDYRKDPEFWLDILEKPNSVILNQRFIEEQILLRVKTLNDSRVESFFGMGYTRMQNLFPLEKDFLSQYYSIGLIGVLLVLSQYILPVVLLALIVIRNKWQYVSFYNMTLFTALVYAAAVAYFSGNILDSLFPSILLSFLLAELLKDLKTKSETNSK